MIVGSKYESGASYSARCSTYSLGKVQGFHYNDLADPFG